MNIDLNKVKQLVSDGYVTIVKHPNAELFLLNYTKKTALEHKWNEITIACRGLIINKYGEIIAKPFNKIFDKPSLPVMNIIMEFDNIKIYEKMDGSLGILYWLNNMPYISTRGSFLSYQAIIANKILYRKYSPTFSHLNRNYTYLFEIISPHNRVVVNYGNDEELVLIGINDSVTGREIPLPHNGELPFPQPKLYPNDRHIIAKLMNSKNLEGLVIRYNDNFIKIKTNWYKQEMIKFEHYKELIYSAILNRESVTDLLSKYHRESDENSVEYIEWSHKKARELYVFLKKNMFSINLRIKENKSLIKDTINSKEFLKSRQKLFKTFRTRYFSSQFISEC